MTNTPPPPPGTPGQPQHGGIQPPSASGTPQPGYGQPQPSAYGTPPSYGAPQSAEKPQAVKIAQIMMYVGAALSALNIIIAILSRGAIEDAVRDQVANDGTSLTDSQIDAAVTFGIIIAVIVGLIGVGLWLWMAWANGNGKKWARIVASVLFGLSALFTLINLTQPGTALETIFSLVGLVLGGVIIFLLWGGKGSKQYFDTMSR